MNDLENKPLLPWLWTPSPSAGGTAQSLPGLLLLPASTSDSFLFPKNIPNEIKKRKYWEHISPHLSSYPMHNNHYSICCCSSSFCRRHQQDTAHPPSPSSFAVLADLRSTRSLCVPPNHRQAHHVVSFHQQELDRFWAIRCIRQPAGLALLTWACNIPEWFPKITAKRTLSLSFASGQLCNWWKDWLWHQLPLLDFPPHPPLQGYPQSKWQQSTSYKTMRG